MCWRVPYYEHTGQPPGGWPRFTLRVRSLKSTCMKTIKKKNATLEFKQVTLDCDVASTYEVFLGSQRLGRVSYERNGADIFITDLFIDPDFTRFGVEEQILGALISSDEVQTVTVVVPLSSVGTYESVGFVCDPSHVLMSKSK